MANTRFVTQRAAGCLLGASLLLAACGSHAQAVYPSHMPATPMPDIKGCTNHQEDFLRKSWRRAHYFTWRADSVLRHVRSAAEGERAQLWNRDHSGGVSSPAVSRWFGPYDAKRAKFVAEALAKAEDRFEMRGQVVKGVKTLRCGSPIAPAQDEHLDVCPDKNPGSSGPPSAYHAPVGTVVTCPRFWDAANDTSQPVEERLNDAARRLVHELFHWLSVDGKYIVDRHADGVGGEKDKKYYGPDNATYLAENKPSWAIRNNDNYAYFARAAGLAAPKWTALFVPKQSAGTGALFLDMSWDGLVAQWKELGDQQYLADVESYVLGGKRKFVGLWRIGEGNGALYSHDWKNFSQTWAELRKTQDLIDIETFEHPQGRRFLGVWQAKASEQAGDGGLHVGLSWPELVDKWKDLSSRATLVDVETYAENGSRKYIGVWQVGGGASALFQHTDWDVFEKTKAELNNAQQMLDYERHQDANGNPHFIGVWRAGANSGPLHRGLSLDKLVEKWKELQASHTLVDVEVSVPLVAELP